MKIAFGTKIKAKMDAYIVFASKEKGVAAPFSKEIEKKLGTKVAHLIKERNFKGKKGEILTTLAFGEKLSSLLVVVGVGTTKEKMDTADFEKIGSDLQTVLNKKKVTSAQIWLSGFKKGIAAAEASAAMATGLLLNDYRFDKYLTKVPKSKKPTLSSIEIVLTAKETVAAKKLFISVKKTVDAVYLTRDVVSEAPNVLYPDSFAKIIQKELKPHGVKVTVLGRSQIRKLGMGALAAVGRGSVREEKLVIMEYKGGKKTQKPIAFVGKGVTFDTGGISLKPGAGMESMKWDMGGAGVVLGLMKALSARKAKANVVAIVALAENMPSGDATRPGDIVKTMSGQTVEIINTDAEGRLILCDALWYCQEKFKPTQIIDLATLTGAMIMALGHEYAGVFSNDKKLPKDLVDASNEMNEPLWHMPLHDAWDKSLNSPAADIKNMGNGRAAGSAVAAHFLQRFIQKGVKWAHLDIAGVAWSDTQRTSVPKGASGFGVRLLDHYVSKYCEK